MKVNTLSMLFVLCAGPQGPLGPPGLPVGFHKINYRLKMIFKLKTKSKYYWNRYAQVFTTKY